MKTWRPGHMYRSDLGTGLEVRDGSVLLWDGSHVVAQAPWFGDAEQLWYELAFIDLFPRVTHWWFHSAWTQAVRASRPVGRDGQGTLYGYMQFIDDQTGGEMWYWQDEQISVPLPSFEEKRGNLPLYLSLCNLVVGLVGGQLVANSWYTISSLVAREELPLVLPVAWEQPWFPACFRTFNPRLEFCSALGILQKNATAGQTRIRCTNRQFL